MSQGRSDIGWMTRHHRSHPSRSWSAIKRSRRANPRIHDSRTNHGRRICGPPYDQLALGARDVLARCSRLAWGLPGFTVTRSVASQATIETISFSRARSTRPTRTEGGPLSQPILPGPRARVPRRSAKSGRGRRYPRCLPSTGYQRPRQWAYARSRIAGKALSTVCHQPVESTRRLFRLSRDPAALTGFR